MFADDCQSQKEVSMSTDVHQKELTAQTSEQVRLCQEGLSTAAAHAVQTCNKETRERVSQASSGLSLVLMKKGGFQSKKLYFP